LGAKKHLVLLGQHIDSFTADKAAPKKLIKQYTLLGFSITMHIMLDIHNILSRRQQFFTRGGEFYWAHFCVQTLCIIAKVYDLTSAVPNIPVINRNA
jgi:hypothetical protein